MCCSYIIGFTDPTLLLDFRDFSALLVVAPKRDIASGPGEVSADVLRKTERRTSFSGKMSGANKKLTLEEMAEESLLVRGEGCEGPPANLWQCFACSISLIVCCVTEIQSSVFCSNQIPSCWGHGTKHVYQQQTHIC